MAHRPGVMIYAEFDPVTLSIKEVSGRILNVCQNTKQDVTKDYEKTVATWTHQVKFGGEVAFAHGMGRVEVHPVSEQDIYSYVDLGTSVRYATMTPGFRPKTRVRTIASYKGQGGKMFVSRKHPRKGIQARNFSLTIRKRHEKPFRTAIKKAVRDGIKFNKLKTVTIG